MVDFIRDRKEIRICTCVLVKHIHIHKRERESAKKFNYTLTRGGVA